MHPIYKSETDGERKEVYEREVHPDRSHTARELRFVYECMRDRTVSSADYKGPFVTTISPDLLTVATEAVRYFTNRCLEVVGTDHLTGRLVVKAPGQS